MEQNLNHGLKIEYGQGLTATAVTDVISFNDREVRVALNGGKRLHVFGENLKISGFNKQSAELRLSGFITAIKYLAQSVSAVKKLFK